MGNVATTSCKKPVYDSARWDNWLKFMVRRYPALARDHEDMLQHARLALWEAQEKYDPAHPSGATFKTYATRMVLAALQQYVQSGPQLIRVGRYGYAQGARITMLRLDEFGADREGTRESDCHVPPALIAAFDENRILTAHLIEKALKVLNERQRFVIDSYYFDETPLKTIGATMGVSLSRANQIKNQSLWKMRKVVQSCS